MAKKSFEENMARLEEIVALLEKGDAQLKAEQQVVRLMKGPDGAPIENEFVSEE